jgi:chorismate mutase
VNEASGRSLAELRAAFDAVDAEIIAAIAKRQALADAAGRLKATLGMAVRDEVREVAAAAHRRAVAADVGADVDVVADVFTVLVEDSRARQQDVVDAP